MPGSAIATELLAVAHRDARALENMLDPSQFEDAIFGFHAQQAVEKALKAWLSFVGESYPFTHDLGYLLSVLDRCGQGASAYSDLLDLNAYAVRFRYEYSLTEDDPLDRAGILRRVHALLEHVTSLMAEQKPE